MENKLQSAAEVAKSLFAELGLTELTIKDGDFELELKKTPAPVAPVLSAAPVMPMAAPVAAPSVTEGTSAPADGGSRSALVNCKEVKSPLVGVLYLASAPGAAPFVSVGDHVSKGDVLCIVEAMKMMNEITSDCEGTVLDVCAGNEDLVEYGQVLFKIG